MSARNDNDNLRIWEPCNENAKSYAKKRKKIGTLSESKAKAKSNQVANNESINQPINLWKRLPTMQLIIKSLLLLCSSAIVVVVGTADAAAAFVGGKSTISRQHSTQIQQHKIISSCSFNTKRVHMTTQSSLSMDDPRVEPRVMYKIDISLHLGLILEDMDSDHSYGVHIVGITPEGNAGESTSHHSNSIWNQKSSAVI